MGRYFLCRISALVHVKEVDRGSFRLLDGGDGLVAASDSLHGDGLASLVVACAVRDGLVGDVHPLPLLCLLGHLLLLQPRRSLPSIETTDHVGGATLTLIQEVLVSSKRLLGKQVVRCRYLVVPVGLDALDGVVGVVVELVKHHLVQLVVHRHRLLPGKEPLGPLVFHLLEPNMTPYFINTVTFIGIGIQNFC